MAPQVDDRRDEFQYVPERPVPDDGPDDGHAIVSVIMAVGLVLLVTVYYYCSK